ncbi:MAG TPA: glycosyltransferase [Caulobacteraceae bacterium]|nr:glycosyltransferase [Caulobacteraceae bacterium]
MSRILYNIVTQGNVSGGHKVAVRHVEALRDLGFDAVCYLAAGGVSPPWFDHRAPMEVAPAIGPDDVLVIADDATTPMRVIGPTSIRTVILSQNPYFFAGEAFEVLDLFPPDRFATFMAVSEGLAATIRRAYPQATVEVVPCFADERLFRPRPHKRFAVAFAPRKRPIEAAAIRALVRKLHPRHEALDWIGLEGVHETGVAQAFGESELYLSLNRLESVGMTTLEAMASGCLCAGFTGVGGLQYATAENGFWVPDEDCEAAADALATAADLILTGGPRLAHYLEAARETARQWSHARFRNALEAAWMRIAPELRRSKGPLP